MCFKVDPFLINKFDISKISFQDVMTETLQSFESSKINVLV